MAHPGSRALATAVAAAALLATAAIAGEKELMHAWGEEIYGRYCASCHGDGGRGDGPVAASLRKASPDLTRIAARSGGTFPRLKVVAIIDGEDPLATHGTREMPVWGRPFRARGGEIGARAELHALANYLESIQRP